MAPEIYGEAEYIADNYGRCTREQCTCIKPRHPWLGRSCPWWKSVTAKTFEELRLSHG